MESKTEQRFKCQLKDKPKMASCECTGLHSVPLQAPGCSGRQIVEGASGTRQRAGSQTPRSQSISRMVTLHEMYPELKHRRASAAERDELGASLSMRTTSLLQT